MIRQPNTSLNMARLRNDREYMLTHMRDSMRSLGEPGGYERFIHELRHVVDAHGGAGEIMRAGGNTRTAIERALAADGQPRLKAIRAILATLGLRLVIEND
jgi:DNA-binding phage protein